MNRFLLTALSIFTLSMTFLSQANAQEFTDAQRAEIKKMFNEFLAESGEDVLSSVNKYQAELEAQDRAEASKKAEGFLKDLDKNKDLPMAGNPKGDITIVEFFDYNCGYCHKALDEVKTVLEKDENVKIVFMDMPILSESSLEAAKWSIAAQKQGKYFEYHQAIMEHKGEKNEKTLKQLAKTVGLDADKLEKDKASPEISEKINAQVKQAQEIGIRGTPGFIVAGQLFPGYIPADQMLKAIEEARK